MSEKSNSSGKLKELIEGVEKLSVLELNDLVKALEEKFGVSAQMAVPAASAVLPADAQAAAEPASFKVELKSAGEQKIAVIKAVKESLGLGLKEVKDLVDSAPVLLKEGVAKEEAEKLKKQIEEVGGQVELS